MTIALPGSTKKGLAGLLGRKRQSARTSPASEKQLTPQQVAQMFNKVSAPAPKPSPSKLNAVEKKDREQLNSLRGALYSKD